MYNTAEGWHAVHSFRLAIRGRVTKTIAITRGGPWRTKMQTCPIMPRAMEKDPCPAGDREAAKNQFQCHTPPPSPLKRYRQGAYGSQPFTYVQLATKLNRFLRKQRRGKKQEEEEGRAGLFIKLFPLSLFFFWHFFFSLQKDIVHEPQTYIQKPNKKYKKEITAV